MKLGFLGLGKMGKRLAEKLVLGGHDVVVWNRTFSVSQDVASTISQMSYPSKGSIRAASTLEDVVKQLPSPKVLWMMLPAGEATEEVLTELKKVLQPGDIVVDGGNAFYQDTQRRSEELLAMGVLYLGVGVSGGIIAQTTGYPLMVGGDAKAYKVITPLLETLSKPHGGYAYFGQGGAGHFVKMVHNAIEYSYMQGIGEGFGILEKSPYQLDLEKVAEIYTKNTLLSGFMMDRTVEVLQQDPTLSKLTGVIGKASAETIWAIDEAEKMHLPIENISQALDFRNKSETDKAIQESFAARMVSALRHAFGGHKVEEK